MSFDWMIQVKNLGKHYRLYKRPIDRLWQFLRPNNKTHYQDFVALHDVSFELHRGQVLGIVGVNGAGKSTLLQLIAGTLQASSGSVQTKGRVAALLELGSGFNPDFTGRENIYLNAAILGLSKQEIDERLSDIIAFADIGIHIDQPVKTYSSGMFIRLAFSIATSVDPDVLIIDEALSVGDGAFARKSFDRIMAIKERGATVLFCSHMLYHIEVFCDKAIWLHQGHMKAFGDVSHVLSGYQAFLDNLAQPNADSLPAEIPQEVPQAAAPAALNGHARIQSIAVSLDGTTGKELYGTSGVSSLQMQVQFASDPVLPSPTVALVISSDSGRILATHIGATQNVDMQRNAQGEGVATVQVNNLPFSKGRYRVGAYLMCEKGVHVYEWIDPAAHIQLHRDGHDQGFFVLEGSWSSHKPS
jgi:lipopolysaccharide transport system ATP-binding protein